MWDKINRGMIVHYLILISLLTLHLAVCNSPFGTPVVADVSSATVEQENL